MSLDNRLFALIYRIIMLFICFVGLLLNVRSGSASVFIYYTIQSNILCLIVTAILVAETSLRLHKDGIKGYNSYIQRFKGATTLAIMVTFLVFHFMLRPALFDMGLSEYANSLENILVHYLVPIMFIIDWLIFDKKGKFKSYDPYLWTVIPLLYFVFTIVRAQVFGDINGSGSRYPYFFIDIDLYGWTVALFVIGLMAFFVVFGYIIVLVDRLYYDKGLKFLKNK